MAIFRYFAPLLVNFTILEEFGARGRADSLVGRACVSLILATIWRDGSLTLRGGTGTLRAFRKDSAQIT